MKTNSLMQKGSGVFTCVECSKRTRDTGENEGETKTCKNCLEKYIRGNHKENCDGCDECKDWKEGVDYI